MLRKIFKRRSATPSSSAWMRCSWETLRPRDPARVQRAEQGRVSQGTPRRRPARIRLSATLSAHHPVLLRAKPRDPHLDDFIRLNVARWLHAVTDTRGCARRDDVAGAQRHEAAHVGDKLPYAEDHVLRVSALP